MTLRTQVLLLQLAVIAVSLAVGFGVVISGSDDRVREQYTERALAIARSVAVDDEVRAQVADHPGTRLDAAALARSPLQAQANTVRARTGALFVVIGNDVGRRLAHPEADRLARQVSTDSSAVLAGREDIAIERGTLGDSVRAKVPVLADDGRVVGFVSVGVSMQRLAADTRRDVVAMVLIALGALAVGAVGSLLLARRWQRLTLGLQPDELAELVREQGAVLHSIADGVLAVDAKGVVRVINATARRLLGITAPVGVPVDDIGLTARVAEVVHEPTPDPRAATVGDRVVLVSSHRVHADGRDLGMVLSVVDRTDVERLTREVDTVRTMSTALRAQRHETANRLHVLGGLLRHDHVDEARAYLDELTGRGTSAGVDGLANVREPHLHAFLDAKAAHARERGLTLTVGDQTYVEGMVTDPVAVTTVVGNLVDNAFDAAAESDDSGRRGRVDVELLADGSTLWVTVADSGPGIAAVDPEQIFDEGVTTKEAGSVPGGRGMGLALARQIARRLGGEVSVADRGGSSAGGASEGGSSGDADGAATEGLTGAVLVARLPDVLDPGDPTADPEVFDDR
ncbi:ATP-binding protein [Gordonia soli]|nr:sensor histidine kinase [Gordonia soli]